MYSFRQSIKIIQPNKPHILSNNKKKKTDFFININISHKKQTLLIYTSTDDACDQNFQKIVITFSKL